MRSPVLAVGAAALLTLSTIAPAAAAPDDYSVTTSATGISLSILGQDALAIGTVEAVADATPSASASGAAAKVLGEDLPGTTSQVSVTSGASTDGANCLIPELPAELSAFLELQALCSTSTGAISGFPTASAEAGLGSAEIKATALVDALTGLLLDPVNAELANVFETVENTVNTTVQDALEEACATAAVPLETVQQTIEDILGDALDPVTSNLPDNNACAVLLDFIADAPQLSDVQAVVDALVADLLDAIGELASIELSLNAESIIANDGSVLTGTSSFGEISLSLPSLDVLDTVVNLALEGPVGGYLDELTELVNGLGGDAPDIPALTDTVADVLAELGLDELLADPTSLLTLDVVGSKAEVAVDTATTAITPSAVAGSITATISPSLAALLGVPESTTVGPGDEVILLEGTPLESRLAVGAASTTETTATGELVAVELLRTVESGIVLNVGATSAEGAAAAPAEPGPAPEPLPVTGGGAMLAALAALGGSRLLRKR